MGLPDQTSIWKMYEMNTSMQRNWRCGCNLDKSLSLSSFIKGGPNIKLVLIPWFFIIPFNFGYLYIILRFKQYTLKVVFDNRTNFFTIHEIVFPLIKNLRNLSIKHQNNTAAVLLLWESVLQVNGIFIKLQYFYETSAFSFRFIFK